MKQPFILSAIAAAWIGAVPAQAQNIAADLLPPYEVSTIVTSMGMRPLDRPIWRDGRYVVRAIDRYGREVRVVIDAQDGQVLAVRPLARDYVYEPRQAPPPPPPNGYYPRRSPYDQPGPDRYDPRYGAPPPSAAPNRPPADDDDEYFDNDRRQGSLIPPIDRRRAVPAPRAPVATGSVSRRVTAIAPNERNDGNDAAAAPLPRPRPALANVNAAERQPSATAPDKVPGIPEEKGTAGAQAKNADTAKKDVRVIDMSKPKAEEKPGDAIRF